MQLFSIFTENKNFSQILRSLPTFGKWSDDDVVPGSNESIGLKKFRELLHLRQKFLQLCLLE